MPRARFLLAALSSAAALLVCVSVAEGRAPCAGERLVTSSTTAEDVADAIGCLVDEQRARFGLGPLSRDARLDAAALGHSADFLARGYFDHMSPEGTGPGERIAGQGYPWTTYGENIAKGHVDAWDVMAGWMASPGHCRNVLAPRARQIGVGVVAGFDGPGYTQVFASTTAGGGDHVPATAAAGCPYALDGPAPAPVDPAASASPGGGASPAAGAPAGDGEDMSAGAAPRQAGRDVGGPARVRVLPLRATWGARRRIMVEAPVGAVPLVTVDGALRRVRRAGPTAAGVARYVTTARLRLRGPVRVTVTDGRTSAVATLAPHVAVRLRVRRLAGAWLVSGAVRPATGRQPLTVRVGGVARRVVARQGAFALRVSGARVPRVAVAVPAGD